MGTDLEKKVDQLTVDNATNVTKIATLENLVANIIKDIKEIKDVLINRPTWQITGILSFLSSAVVALVVLLFTLHSGK